MGGEADLIQEILPLTFQHTRDHNKFLPLYLALRVNCLQYMEHDNHVKYSKQYKNIMSKKSLEIIHR